MKRTAVPLLKSKKPTRPGNAIRRGNRPRRSWGLGELSLVEHALCPLHTPSLSSTPLLHRTHYWYTDRHRNRKQATAVIKAVDGLSANDEFYLWGILGIIFSQPEPSPVLFATRNYILRRLGFSVGGENYVTLRAALGRLAGAKYTNDRFYDPVRGEHRQVSFGFLSFSLPADPNSPRGWQIALDPIFYSLIEPLKTHFWFDLEIYCSLDTASRRLYLVLKKVFHRSPHSPRWNLYELGVQVLGYSEKLKPKELRRKIRGCAQRLGRVGVLDPACEAFSGSGRSTTVQFQRAAGPVPPSRRPAQLPVEELPIYDQWLAIGVDEEGMAYLRRNFTMESLQEWADITLAARERHGPKFFDRSMAAYYIDNVKTAKSAGRRPPDWWYEFKKQEQQLTRRDSQTTPDERSAPTRQEFVEWICNEGRPLYEEMLRQILGVAQVGGLVSDSRAQTARREADGRMWQEFLIRRTRS